MNCVLVAGGATGIGAAAVRAFRAQGDAVYLADRNGVGAKAVVAEGGPGVAEAGEFDFADPESPARAIAAAAEFAGGLDTVFYNAGVLDAHPLSEWTTATWDRAVAVNLRAPFFMAQAAAPWLAASACGRLIVTSSTGGIRGHAGMPAYHATKSGVLGLVRSLADELGPLGVTVNALCPGWVDTPFNSSYWSHQEEPEAALRRLTATIPLRRQAVPDDIVGTVLFLASPAAAYITGQAIVVDGGYTAV